MLEQVLRHRVGLLSQVEIPMCPGMLRERGGDVAIGLHDYPYPELGLPTNAELIARVADLARSMGREVATAAEAREILALN